MRLVVVANICVQVIFERCDELPIRAYLVRAKHPASAVERGMKKRGWGVTEGTEQSKCDGADLGCVCGAEAEDVVFRKGSVRTGGLERVHSDGDEGVLCDWVENGVVEKDGVVCADPGDDTTVGGVERGRGRRETVIVCVWRGKRICLEERAPSSWGVERHT